jgi:hypothetical protein
VPPKSTIPPGAYRRRVEVLIPIPPFAKLDILAQLSYGNGQFCQLQTRRGSASFLQGIRRQTLGPLRWSTHGCASTARRLLLPHMSTASCGKLAGEPRANQHGFTGCRSPTRTSPNRSTPSPAAAITARRAQSRDCAPLSEESSQARIPSPSWRERSHLTHAALSGRLCYPHQVIAPIERVAPGRRVPPRDVDPHVATFPSRRVMDSQASRRLPVALPVQHCIDLTHGIETTSRSPP